MQYYAIETGFKARTTSHVPYDKEFADAFDKIRDVNKRISNKDVFGRPASGLLPFMFEDFMRKHAQVFRDWPQHFLQDPSFNDKKLRATYKGIIVIPMQDAALNLGAVLQE